MSRALRVEFPGACYHVMARGVARQDVFRDDADRRRFLAGVEAAVRDGALEVLAFCLTPNHVHLIVTPRAPDALARGIGEVHRRYTWAVNRERRWRGFLWQGRFSSYILGDTYLLNATRYALRNPVEPGARADRARAADRSAARGRSGDRSARATCRPATATAEARAEGQAKAQADAKARAPSARPAVARRARRWLGAKAPEN